MGKLNQDGRDASIRPYIELFEAMAASQPENLAVSDSKNNISYTQLNQIANRFAYEMAALGIKRGDIVAIAHERDVFFPAAILALFKLGAAYVPLDAETPRERVVQMLTSCHCNLILSSRPLHAKFQDAAGDMRTVICLEDWHERGPLPIFNRTPTSNTDLAYIIFTSGSTGAPKGAMVAQEGMVNHIWAKVEDLALQANDIVAQNASQCFDISVWQFLLAFVVGGRVAIVEKSDVLDIHRFLQRIASEQVTILEVVPSYLLALLDFVEIEASIQHLRQLRAMIVTGEALPVTTAQRWFELRADIPLVNAYGPTECSDDVTHQILTKAPQGQTVPIGRAVRGVDLYVLNDNLQPVAEGESGELCVSGIAVGLGYIAAPDITQKAFVDDPFCGVAGKKMYRTGDLVRQQGGVFEYIGRLDQQVKLRGYRIELGEIETNLRRDPRIRSAAVVLIEGSAHKELAALIVERQASDEQDHAERQLDIQEMLHKFVPEYMVPQHMMFATHMPLNPNGKIDRHAVTAMLTQFSQRDKNHAL